MRRFAANPWLATLLIFGSCFAIYASCLNHEFLTNWDDPLYVSANPDVQSVSLANLRDLFTSTYAGNYAPVQMLSYMADDWLWNGRPAGFILVNVLLHGLNGSLFCVWLRRIGMPGGLALLAALLFTVHPVQVESVAWISQRKTLLAMTFFLGALCCYHVYAREAARRWTLFVCCLLFFTLALLSKAVVVILPAVLLLYDLTLRPASPPLRIVLAEKVPFLLLSLFAVRVTTLSQGGAILDGYHGGSLWTTVLTMLPVYRDYLVNLAWPLKLSAIYLENLKFAIDVEVLVSAGLLLATWATLWLFPPESRRSASFWLTLFFLGLAPVSQIIPMMTLMNDRYLYFPLLGFSVYLLLLLQSLARRFQVRQDVSVALFFVGLLLLAPVAWSRTIVWENALTLWQDTVQKQPHSSWAWSLLGDAQRKAGDFGGSITSYQRAVGIDPDLYQYHYELGRVFQHVGESGLAVQAYSRVLQLKPDHAGAWSQLSLIDKGAVR